MARALGARRHHRYTTRLAARQARREDMKLDRNRTWKLVEKRLADERDPTLRRNLELVLEHMKAEAKGDIEGVVATLTERPRYVTYQNPDDPILNPVGSKDAVRRVYAAPILQKGAL